MDKNRIHVIKRENGWAVKKEGGLKATRIYSNKKDAEENSMSYRKKGYDVIIHRTDGSIEKWEKAQV